MWKPRALKLDALPYDDVDFAGVLDALAAHGFVVKYEAAGRVYGCIPSWSKHQYVNARESASLIPPPGGAGAPAHESEPETAQDAAHVRTCMHQSEPVPARREGEEEREQEQEKEREGKGRTRAAPPRAAPPRQNPMPLPARHAQSPPDKASRAARWPEDAVVPDDWLDAARELRREHGLPEIDLRLEAAQFQNYWASKSGGAAVKLDWRKTWDNWVLKAYGNGRTTAHSGKSSHPFGVFGSLLERERERDGGGGAIAREPPDQSGEGRHPEGAGAAQRGLRSAAR